MNPTAMVIIGGEACAFTEKGEIVCAPLNGTLDGLQPRVAWDDGCVADPRGAGGLAGFQALHRSLQDAEANARLVGFDVVRLPDGDGDEEAGVARAIAKIKGPGLYQNDPDAKYAAEAIRRLKETTK